MLTAWAKKGLLATISENMLFSLSNSGDGKKAFNTAKTVLNNTAYITSFSSYHTSSVQIKEVNESSGDGIWIGSDNTPATENDYFLGSVISSGASASVNSGTVYDSTNNSMIQRLTITISNTGDSDLTINEVARTCVFDTASEIGEVISGSSRKNIMIDRTVFDQPLVISPGTAGVFYYDFIYFDGTPEPTTAVRKA